MNVGDNKAIHDHRVSDPTSEDLSKEINQGKERCIWGACSQKHGVLRNDE